MKTLNKIFVLVLVMFTLLMLLSFGVGASKKSNSVIMAIQTNWKTFDPARSYEPWAAGVFNGVYDNLVIIKSGMSAEIEGSLAESYEISSDGLTFTFNLRPGIKFASGNNLTSKDVKWSFDRLKNIKGNPAFLTDTIDRIETPDDKSVVIHLSEGDGAFLHKLTSGAFGVLDSELVKSHGGTADKDAATTDDAEQWLIYNSAGSGSYVIEKYTPNDEMVLKRNENYWRGPASVEKIVFKEMPDSTTQIFMLKRGDIDVAFSLNEDQIKELKSEEDIEIRSFMTLMLQYLFMNTDPEIGGPMANPDIWKAVRYALDYKGIHKIVGEGAITPQSIIQVGFLGALPPRDPNYTNIEKAKELLVKAGYPNGFTTTLWTNTHATCGVKWVTMAQKVKEDLSKIGINVQIKTQTPTIGIAAMREGKVPFMIQSWGPDYMDSNNQLVFLPGEMYAANRLNWKSDANPKLAQLGKTALIEANNKKRAEILGEIQKIMAEDSPYANIVQYPIQIAIRKGLKGLEYSDSYRVELYKLSW